MKNKVGSRKVCNGRKQDKEVWVATLFHRVSGKCVQKLGFLGEVLGF